MHTVGFRVADPSTPLPLLPNTQRGAQEGPEADSPQSRGRQATEQRQTGFRAEADRLLWPVFCGENKTGKTGLSRQKQTGKKTGKKAGEQTGKKTGERTRQT